MDFNEVRTQDFSIYEGLFNKGFSDSSFWIRLHIDPSGTPDDEKLVLRIRPSFLDEIRLFDPDFEKPGEEGKRVTGDRFPIENNAYPSLSNNFIAPMGEQPRYIWLRLRTTSTNMIDVEVLSLRQSLQRDRLYELFFSLYLALLFLYLVWGLYHWFSNRESLMVAFIVKQVFGILYSLGFLGYFGFFWSQFSLPGSPDMFFTVLVVFFAASAYHFDYAFLKEFTPKPLLLGIIATLQFIFLIALLLVVSGDIRKGLVIANILALILPFLSLATALSIPSTQHLLESEQPPVPKHYVVILYFLILISVSVSTFAAMGFVDAVEWSLNGFLMYSLWTGFAVVTLLQIRAFRLGKRRVAVEMALAGAEQRAVVEEQKRREVGRFLAMLIHELKTPLAVVRMVLGAPHQTPYLTKRAEESIDEMSAVIERCLQTDQLDNMMIEPRITQCNINEMLYDLISGKSDRERISFSPSAEYRAETDNDLLRITFSNLLDNAIKYSEDNSLIDVKIKSEKVNEKDGLLLEVANLPGRAGWPEPDKVFKKYYRSSGSHEFTGSGLGLFLIDGLVSLLKGDIAYKPTQTHVVFSLWIPLSQ